MNNLEQLVVNTENEIMKLEVDRLTNNKNTNNLEQDVITTENDILKIENVILKIENERLKRELVFMNKIFKEFPSSVVYNLERFTMKGKPIWIDTHLVTLQELNNLDQTDDVKDLIHSKTSSRYDDSDW